MLPVDAVAPRRAALLLHALPEKARTQVMQQLSAPHRETVQALLIELRAMGIPHNRDWLSLVEHDAALVDTPVERADRLQAADVLRALEGQPLSTLAAVLGLRDWTWRAGVLAAMPADRRIRLNTLLGAGTAIKDPVAQALLGKLLDRVAQATTASTDPVRDRGRRPVPGRSWLHRLFQ